MACLRLAWPSGTTVSLCRLFRESRCPMSQITPFPQRHVQAARSQNEASAPELSIIIPTFKERGNIAPLVERLDAALAGHAWEAIFVDDDSPDGTAEMVRSIGAADLRVRC